MPLPVREVELVRSRLSHAGARYETIARFPLAEPFRETGDFMPHPLETEEAETVVAVAIAAAEALGVRSGALHTEIKLTPDGPRIIEVNGRIGGGAIDALYARRFGTSLTELAESIPPAYTEYIGAQLLMLNRARGAA